MIFICIPVFVCLCPSVFLYLWVCVPLYFCIFVFVSPCIPVFMCFCPSVFLYVCVCVPLYSCICVFLSLCIPAFVFHGFVPEVIIVRFAAVCSGFSRLRIMCFIGSSPGSLIMCPRIATARRLIVVAKVSSCWLWPCVGLLLEICFWLVQGKLGVWRFCRGGLVENRVYVSALFAGTHLVF